MSCRVHGPFARCACGYARFFAVLGGVGFLLTACGLLQAPPPETAARDAYRLAKAACRAYELLPGEKRTEELDRSCRAMRLVCE